MRPYMSLLVLVLATSVVAVQETNPPTFETPPLSEITPPSKVGSTPATDLNQKPRFKITKTKVVLGLETLSLATLIAMAADPHLFANNDDSTTRRSIPTNPSTTPPREFTGREVCIPDHRGLSVDTSSEPYPKSYLDGVADCVVITVGHSKARSVSDNNQKMDTSSLDLLNRAHLEEAVRLFSRMLDELD